VESDSSGNRTGEITVEYSNGVTKSTTVQQNTSQPHSSLQKSYAVGWGIDITTYMDSRGLKDQIFNTQRVINANPQYLLSTRSTIQNILVFYGDSYATLNEDINASLSTDIKVSAFELNLKGNFGNNALKDSKRFFSWMRGIYSEQSVDMSNVDLMAAYDKNLLTKDFAEQYQEVIDAKASDASIRNLINIQHLIMRNASRCQQIQRFYITIDVSYRKHIRIPLQKNLRHQVLHEHRSVHPSVRLHTQHIVHPFTANRIIHFEITLVSVLSLILQL
jgi:hypothetical protein